MCIELLPCLRGTDEGTVETEQWLCDSGYQLPKPLRVMWTWPVISVVKCPQSFLPILCSSRSGHLCKREQEGCSLPAR